MKKLYFLLVATLVAFTVNAQTLVFEETFNDWTDGTGIQSDANWMGVDNSNGWIADGTGIVIPSVGYRGGTQNANPISGWADGEKIRLTVDLGVDWSAEVGDLIQKRLSTRVFGLFGLTTDVDGTGGSWGATANTYNANTLGFRFEQNAWINPNGSNPSGSLKFFPYFGSNDNAEAYIPSIEDMGANLQGLIADGVTTASIEAAGVNDLLTDVIRVTYNVVKEANAGEFTIDVVVENLTTQSSVAIGPYTVDNATIHGATDVYFTAVTNNGGPFVFMDNVKLEKGIPLAIGDKVNAANGLVYVSGKTLYVKDVEAATSQVKVYNLSGVVVAEDEFAGSSYTKTLDLAKGLYIVKIGTQTTKVMVK